MLLDKLSEKAKSRVHRLRQLARERRPRYKVIPHRRSIPLFPIERSKSAQQPQHQRRVSQKGRFLTGAKNFRPSHGLMELAFAVTASGELLMTQHTPT